MSSKSDIQFEEASGQEARPQPGQGVAATFDTSGHFHVMPGHPLHRFMGVNRLEWSDLSPFTQGYVEAMAISSRHQDAEMFAFRQLAPETLARIMEDCESVWVIYKRIRDPHPDDGKAFWEMRQADDLPDYPPLAPYLGDDGKVYLRESAQ